jgi:hypothetical protein
MKNNITYITYATGEKYIEASSRIFEETRGLFDSSIIYGREDLDMDFYKKNSKVLDSKKGAGYWLWKPYLILKTMEKISNDDIVFYLDLGDQLYNSISNFIRETIAENSGFFLVSGNFINKDWTKQECFNLMESYGENYKETNQLEAGCCAFQKSDNVISFLKEWLFFCSDYRVVSDDTSIANDRHFIEHRYDQSILTNLAIKHNVKTVPISTVSNYITYNKYF